MGVLHVQPKGRLVSARQTHLISRNVGEKQRVGLHHHRAVGPFAAHHGGAGDQAVGKALFDKLGLRSAFFREVGRVFGHQLHLVAGQPELGQLGIAQLRSGQVFLAQALGHVGAEKEGLLELLGSQLQPDFVALLQNLDKAGDLFRALGGVGRLGGYRGFGLRGAGSAGSKGIFLGGRRRFLGSGGNEGSGLDGSGRNRRNCHGSRFTSESYIFPGVCSSGPMSE